MAPEDAAHPTLPSPGLSDYGRGKLTLLGWVDYAPTRIEPGRFLIGTGEPFKCRVVPEGDPVYIGIALDRPQPGNLMAPSDLTNFQDHPPEGRMGDYGEVDQRRARIGNDRADRAFDMSAVLERLLERFRAAPRHQNTGYLAEARTPLGVTHAFDSSKPGGGGKLLRCVCPPINSPIVLAADGTIYASHFAMVPPPAFQDEFTPMGYAGRLTLVGQITGLWGVLQDRFLDLISTVPTGARIEAIQAIAGGTTHPIVWGADERRHLERARGELPFWRAGTPSSPVDTRRILTDLQREVWLLLNERCKTAKELAIAIYDDRLKENVIRNLISRMNKAGWEVQSRKSRGYFRPDAPPSD